MSTGNSKDVSAAAEEQNRPVAGETHETSSQANTEPRPAAAPADSPRKDNVAGEQTAGQVGSNVASAARSSAQKSRSNPPPRQQTPVPNPGGYRSSVTVDRKKKMAAAVSQRKALQLPEDMESPTESLLATDPSEINLEAPVPEEITEKQVSANERETSELHENGEQRTNRDEEAVDLKKKPMSTTETVPNESPEEAVHDSPQDEEKRKMERDFEEMLSTFVIPDNIDPVLLEVWMRREKEAFFKKRRGEDVPSLPRSGRKGSFAMLFASYLSVLVMIILILFGMIAGTHPEILLKKVFLMMVCFFILGYIVGIIVDNCISESARAMIRELIKRSHEAQEAKNAEIAATTASP